MPSPLEHLSIAIAVSEAIGLDRLGPFFAGAVAPDVDKLLGRPRGTTHWWLPGSDLSGALRLIAARPRLAHAVPRSDLQRFTAGYLCHLVTDELWTLRIYRPFFGRASPFAGGRDGADHQLALQGLLDTQLIGAGRITPAIHTLARLTRIEDLARDVVATDARAVERFIQTVIKRATIPDEEARLRLITTACEAERAGSDGNAPRHVAGTLVARTTDDHTSLEAFVARLPELRASVTGLVAPTAIVSFRNVAIATSVDVVRAYMGGHPLPPPPGTTTAPYFASPARTDL